jgi:hypothetical protein
LQEPTINRVEEQLRFHAEIDEGELLSGNLFNSSQVGNQLFSPMVEGLAESASTVYGPCTVLLQGTFHEGKAVLGIAGIGLLA